MASWSTAVLPTLPTRTAPSESIDIRMLPNLPSGEITHAQMTSPATSKAAFMDKVTEFFFILEGEGRLWRRSGQEEVIELPPGRCVSIPPGVHFQLQCTQPRVDEIWYVLGGAGAMWCAEQRSEQVVELRPGTCVTVPVGVSFQFRSGRSTPLEILIGTFPRWPGPDEAVPVSGHWPRESGA